MYFFKVAIAGICALFFMGTFSVMKMFAEGTDSAYGCDFLVSEKEAWR